MSWRCPHNDTVEPFRDLRISLGCDELGVKTAPITWDTGYEDTDEPLADFLVSDISPNYGALSVERLSPFLAMDSKAMSKSLLKASHWTSRLSMQRPFYSQPIVTICSGRCNCSF